MEVCANSVFLSAQVGKNVLQPVIIERCEETLTYHVEGAIFSA